MIETLVTGTIDSSGFKLNYIIEGEGYPALVIGSAHYYRKTFSSQIKEHFQFIFADHRGFAEPPLGRLGNELFTLDVLVDDIEFVRMTLGIEKMLIIGHSGHAFMALEYAKKYPTRVIGVVMIAVTPDYSLDTHKVADDFFDK